MRRFLLATLHAPIGSFGAVAVGEWRPSWPRPGRSAALGLLAAALGTDRSDEAGHRQLEEGLGFAVRTDAPGAPFTDYHTATAVQPLRNQRFTTRRQALDEGKQNTLVSEREWYSDTFFTLCFWLRGEAREPDLEVLAAALNEPAFTLYCGRKAGTLGLPTRPEIVKADGVIAGLEQRRFNELEADVLRRLFPTQPGEPWIACDADAPGLPEGALAETRADSIASRSRWMFSERLEVVLPRGEAATQ